MTVQPIIPDATPPAEAVRATRCPLCHAAPGAACTLQGDHVARWLSACDAGAISRGDLRAVIVLLVVVSQWCVVPGSAVAA